MKRLFLTCGISLLVMFYCLSCGGGGDESNAGSLSGIWMGVVEDNTGSMHELSIQIDGAGNVVEVKIDDVVTGYNGYINEDWDPNLFHVFYTAGIVGTLSGGILIVDNSNSYVLFADRNLWIGVLQNSAVALPTYQSSDIVGSFSGDAYRYVDTGGIWNWEGDDMSLTVAADLTFFGNFPGPMAGEFDALLISPTYGGYDGSINAFPSLSMDMKAFMSPDKNFIAAYAWDDTTTPTGLYDYVLMGLAR